MRKGAASVNPSGKSKVPEITRNDGWASALSGAGTKAKDRLENYGFGVDPISEHDARELYRGDDIAATAVDLPADDMTRGGYTVSVSDNPETQARVAKAWKDIGLIAALKKAEQYSRAYGGAGIYLGTVDTGFLEDPMQNVRGLTHCTVFKPSELVPKTWYVDPLQPKCGFPETYELHPKITGDGAPQTYKVLHESRLLLFGGIRVDAEGVQNHGFGDSIFVRMRRTLRDFNIAWQSTATLLQDFAPAVHKIKGLASLLSTSGGDALLQKRLSAINMSRATAREVIIDMDEEWGRSTTPVSGLPELLREFMARLSVATGIPVNILFGLSSSGLNATDETTVKNWYSKVASMQMERMVPHIERVTQILLDSWGISEDFTIEPNPLFKSTDREQAEVRKINAETDEIYWNIQVLASEEILQRFTGPAYVQDIVVDLEAHEALELSEADVNEVNEAVPEPSDVGQSDEP